jgi:hypothetical protein
LFYSVSGYAFSQWKKVLLKRPTGNRLKIIEKNNFDTKFSMHCIRLMYECLELLNNETLTLPGVYNKELLDIRLGKTKYEDVLKKYEDLKFLTEQAYVNTRLSKEPDKNKLNKLLIELIEEYWEQGIITHD